MAKNRRTAAGQLSAAAPSLSRPAGPDSPRYRSLAEAAEYAGIPPSTLRHYIRVGIVPGYRIGPRLLQVDLNDLDELRRRVPTVQPSDRAVGE